MRVTALHSIRFKATAITIAEILAAMLCVFLASYSIVHAESDRRSVEMMDLLAQDTAKSFEEYTTGIARSVDMVANLAGDTLDSVTLARCGVIGEGVALDERTPEQQAQLNDYLASFAAGIQVEFAAVAEHTYGVETYYFAVNPDIADPELGFYYSHVGRTGFFEREPFDARNLDPDDPAHSGWYFIPVQRGRPTWIGPFPATSLNELLICSYVVPLYKSGTLVGVLGMDIPFYTLSQLVDSIEVYDTGFVCLLDGDGTVIYHPELDRGATLSLPVGEDVFRQEDSAGMLIRYTSVTGEERQMSFTTLSNDMKLVVVAPTDEVDEPTLRLQRTVLPIASGIVVVITLISLLIMGRLTGPLQRLTAASLRLADADYDVELDCRSDDEVGALTTAFQRMRAEIEANIEDLSRRVRTDDLTGLPNQRHFFDLAQAEHERLLACGKVPVVLFFNLVGMKYFNRQYGFDEGDRLICAIADVLADHFGELCTSRFGQDHFAVISDEGRLEERLRAVFDDCARANDGRTLPVSVGIYHSSLGDVNVSAACDRAKFACDRRGDSYVSGFSYFTEGMQRQVEIVRHVIGHLDEALERGWVQVRYQPIVRAVNGKVCDEEALSRWIDPERGELAPGDFVPALEGAGLIWRLDLYVLDRVLEKMHLQRQMGLIVVPHSINLSRSDFDACDMVEEIRRRVDAAGLPHAMISVEITESVVGRDFDFMKEQVERFQALGFPVWMDDFGSGYSSLDMLQSIGFDLLKFDMSFMRKLDAGESGKIILTELMRMATALGVDTICEGVETESQVRFLREIGCSKLQGYYYCRPIPLEKIVERYRLGIQIGYENPAESDYFEGIGKVNLHDLTAIAHGDEDTLQNAFNMVPMAIVELAAEPGTGELGEPGPSAQSVQFTRTNQAFRDFVRRYFWPSLAEGPVPAAAPLSAEAFFRAHAQECCDNGGSRLFFDEALPDGSIARCLMRHIRTNPVTGTTAIVVGVLSIA